MQKPWRPFTAVPRATLRQSAKKVYAHWHYYPVSLDNYNPTSNDYYERNYIAVTGEGGHALGLWRHDARASAPEADAAGVRLAASRREGRNPAGREDRHRFKTGVKPTIERDVLYYSHRIYHQSLVPTKQTSANLAACRAGCPATNEVELVGFLRSAGRLEITPLAVWAPRRSG